MRTQLHVKDIRLLQVFCEVTDAGGISAAQESLGMTQPNISVLVADLETRLGVTLCERGRAGFRLTGEGEQAYRSAQQLLADLADYSDQLQAIGRGLRGDLLIGYVDDYLTHPDNPLVPVMAEMGRISREIHFNLRQGSLVELEQRLGRAEIQVAIGNFERRLTDVEYYPLHEETQLLCCGESHPFFSRSDKQLGRDEILGAGHACYDNTEIDQATELLNPVATVHKLEGNLMFLLAGLGVGFLPDHVAQRWLDSGSLRVIQPRNFNRSLHFSLAVRKASLKSPLVSAFVERVRTAVT